MKKEISSGNTESSLGLNIGNKAPEIEYPSPDGKSIKLSSLKGKIVLIDFWASWCPPCRQENPNHVKSYEHFRNAEFRGGKGFTSYELQSKPLTFRTNMHCCRTNRKILIVP